jgi:hypothetical protein
MLSSRPRILIADDHTRVANPRRKKSGSAPRESCFLQVGRIF